MAAELALLAFGEATPDLAVQAFALPVRHCDVSGERVEQLDVALGVVSGLPVVLPGLEQLEETG